MSSARPIRRAEREHLDRLPTSRRGFLQALLAGGTGLVLATRSATGAARMLDAARGTAPAAPAAWSPDVFLSIGDDGVVTIVAHRSEMGTGIRTALPMVVADELGADWETVEIVQADGDAKYGSQNTDGSRSIRNFYLRMRQVGATARTMLERAAAAEWDVDPGSVRTADGKVVHEASGRSLGFGALASKAAALEVPPLEQVELKPRSELKMIARDKAVPIVDGRDITTGKATYGIDARRPDQLFAVVARPPVVGGRVKEIANREAALAVRGVEQIVELPAIEPPYLFKPLGGVAVLANSTYAAKKARDMLQITWDHGPNAGYGSSSYDEALLEAVRAPGKVVRNRGDVEKAMGTATRKVEAEYQTPTLSHAPMEPPAALAEFVDGRVECWAPSQDPQAAKSTVAQVLGLEPDAVTVHVTLLGGGFGRKSKPDFLVEAAWLSRKVGRPVHVTWMREDDIRHDYFHAEAATRYEAGLGEDGKPVAWLQRSAFPSIGNLFQDGTKHAMPLEMGLGFVDLPYDVANIRCENGEAAAHMRFGWLRAVSNLFHTFGQCSFADECAHAAGKDPVDYLRTLIGPARHVDLDGAEYPNYGMGLDDYPLDTGRLRRVLDRVAEAAGWGREMPKGRALGIAVHRSFHCYVGCVVEVEVGRDGTVGVPDVWYSLDAGLLVHPDRVRSQFEGSAVFGHSLAMYGEITTENGAVQQGNFDTYRMARMGDAPRRIHVDLVEEAYDELPGGIGEPGVPPYAPALCNAVFAATGKRVRRLPLANQDLSWG